MTTMIKLTIEQKLAADMCAKRITNLEPLTTLGGYAGTGKSVVCGAIAERVRSATGDRAIAFACYTGKAKRVLEAKLTAAGALSGGDFVGTLHSFLMQARVSYLKHEDGTVEKVVRFEDRDNSDREFSCVIIDEASMVDSDMLARVEKLGIPILAVGDHGQLPPVRSSFNLMANPDVKLNYIHRQAEGDAIIRVSAMAREGIDIPECEDGNVIKTKDGSVLNTLEVKDWTFICGTNRKRVRMNAWARERMGIKSPDPVKGDRIICLENNHKKGIMNGMTGVVTDAAVDDLHWIRAVVAMDGGEDVAVRMFRYQFGKEKPLKATALEAPDVHPDDFGDLFDFGYCLTAHKSQGSEFDNVVVFEDRAIRNWLGEDGYKRYFYTSITRAKKRLIIIGD